MSVLPDAPELLVPPCAPGEPLAPMDCEPEVSPLAAPVLPVLPVLLGSWLPAPIELLPPGLASVEDEVPGDWFGVAEGVGVSALPGLAEVALSESLRGVDDDEPVPVSDPEEDPCARTMPARVRVRSPASVGRRTERRRIDAFISGTP